MYLLFMQCRLYYNWFIIFTKIFMIYLWILLPVKNLNKCFVTEAQTHRNPSHQQHTVYITLIISASYSVYNMCTVSK